LPEAAVEVDLLLGPQRLHQPDALGEAGDVRLAVDAERGEGPEAPAAADADLEAPAAELVEGGEALGQVWRGVQRGHVDRAAQAQTLGAGEGVGHRLVGRELWERAQDLLLGPPALEAQVLGSSQVGAERAGVERPVGHELRDGDREAHGLESSCSGVVGRG
jgi:hypothetical protein